MDKIQNQAKIYNFFYNIKVCLVSTLCFIKTGP